VGGGRELHAERREVSGEDAEGGRANQEGKRGSRCSGSG